MDSFDILNLSFAEIFFLILLALVLFGPEEMVRYARLVGKFLRRITRSSTWVAVVDASRTLRGLPNRLMREAGLEEELESLRAAQEEIQAQMQVERISRIKRSMENSGPPPIGNFHNDRGWTVDRPAPSGSEAQNPPDLSHETGSAPPPVDLSPWISPLVDNFEMDEAPASEPRPASGFPDRSTAAAGTSAAQLIADLDRMQLEAAELDARLKSLKEKIETMSKDPALGAPSTGEL